MLSCNVEARKSGKKLVIPNLSLFQAFIEAEALREQGWTVTIR